MNDLISRKAAIEAIRALPHLYGNKEQRARTGGLADAAMAIRDLPTVETKHGEWIFHSIESPYRWECNKCGDKVRARYNFCPNCGAKMERSEE